mgnify:CR=1 FL=1
MRAQPTASHYIDGEYVEDEAGATLQVVYPATGEVIATLHAATPALIERAVAAAKRAQGEWGALRPIERARILRRAHDLLRERNDEIARIESLDTGRAVSETMYVDAVSVAEALEFYSGVIASYN